MSTSYQFIDADQDIAGVELIQDTEQGPVLWLQTSPNGCYIPADQLDEFVKGLRGLSTHADTAA